MEHYRNKYRNDSARLKNWDYGSPGYYYVTICTKDRRRYFGDVVMRDGNEGNVGTQPWEGVCDGMRDGMVGTHNHASLPPGAHPPHEDPPPGAHPPHAVVRLTTIGKIARQNWVEIPAHFPFVVLDEFIAMPDHMHGILCFQKPGYREHNVNRFGPQSKNLGSVIRSFKSATKAYATLHHIEFAWHTRYFDNVITSGKELDNIRRYIRYNPDKWISKNTK